MRVMGDVEWYSIEEPVGRYVVFSRWDMSIHLVRSFADGREEAIWRFYAPDMLRTEVTVQLDKNTDLMSLAGWDVVRLLDDAFQSMNPRNIEEALYTTNSWLTAFVKAQGRTGNAEFLEEYIEKMLELLICIETNSTLRGNNVHLHV